MRFDHSHRLIDEILHRREARALALLCNAEDPLLCALEYLLCGITTLMCFGENFTSCLDEFANGRLLANDSRIVRRVRWARDTFSKSDDIFDAAHFFEDVLVAQQCLQRDRIDCCCLVVQLDHRVVHACMPRLREICSASHDLQHIAEYFRIPETRSDQTLFSLDRHRWRRRKQGSDLLQRNTICG